MPKNNSNNKSVLPQTSFTIGTDIASQRLLIGLYLSQPKHFRNYSSLFVPKYFDDSFETCITFINKHAETHKTLPTIDLINQFDKSIIGYSPSVCLPEFIGDELTKFAKRQVAIATAAKSGTTGDFKAIADGAKLISEISPREKTKFDGFFVDEFAEHEDPKLLIGPWLLEDTVTCVFGAPGSYKSFFCLHAAFCLASGMPFNGMPVEKTNVVYVAAEGQSGLMKRFEAIEIEHGKKCFGKDFLLIPRKVNLLDPVEIEDFICYLKDLEDEHGIKFGVVFIDTYSQCIAGADENSAAVASIAADSMRRVQQEMKSTVVFVHHTGKNQALGMRGSDALRGNTDAAIEIKRTADTLDAVAGVTRQKEAEIGGKINFTMKIVDIPRLTGKPLNTSLVCTFPAITASGAKASANSKMVLQGQLRQILNVIKPGDKITVATLCERLGQSKSPHYKKKITELLPLDVHTDVKDNSGKVLGVLVRTMAGAASNNENGMIKCLARHDDEPAQLTLLGDADK